MTEAPTLNRKQRRDAAKLEKKNAKRAPKRVATRQEAMAFMLKPLALLNDCKTYNGEEIAHDLLKIRSCYDRLKDCTADEEDFNRVAVAINLSKVRALEIDETLANGLEEAQDAMTRARIRREKHGKFGFDGVGLQAMEYGMEAHEAIVMASSPKQMQNAMSVVRDVLLKQSKKVRALELMHEVAA